MAFTFFNWLKRINIYIYIYIFLTREHDMKFKFQCPQIKSLFLEEEIRGHLFSLVV